jgi:hypothetical protein
MDEQIISNKVYKHSGSINYKLNEIKTKLLHLILNHNSLFAQFPVKFNRQIKFS